MSAITLYRCRTCGKWSHAARKPRKHERFIRADAPASEQPGPETVVIEERPPYGEEDCGGWMVECGPFQTFEATEVQDATGEAVGT